MSFRTSTSIILLLFSFPTACAANVDTAPDDPSNESAFSSSASALPECHVDGVRTIARPRVRGSQTSFAYSFRLHRASASADAATAPTVIYLPGGPGQGAIATPREQIAVPPSFNVIATDPRGASCNAPPAGVTYDAAFYRTDEIVDDVLAIVEAEHLSDYSIYGTSYGTYLGTLVAHRAELRGIATPRALVLEGVLGRTFAPNETEVAYHERWAAIRDQLPEAARAKIVAEIPPLGLSAKDWGSFIRTGLSIGQMAGASAPFLAQLLSLLASDDPAVVQPLIDNVKAFAAQDRNYFGDEHFMRVYQNVGCGEVAETMSIDFELVRGELVSRQDLCGAHAVTEPYSAANHQVSMPIFYFEGRNDPNTPFWQAEFHFDSQQRATQKTLIGVPNAGHNPLGINLAACSSALWTSIQSGSAIDAALATCPSAVEIRTGAAAAN